MTIRSCAEIGVPIKDSLIIDCHAHLGNLGQFNINEPGEESMVNRMNRLGIIVACISHHLAIGPDAVQGNKLAEHANTRFPDRLYFYVVINPCYPDLIRDQIEKYILSCKAIGFKIHPAFHDTPLDHPNYEPVYEEANRCNGIVLGHVWGMESVNAIDRLASRYPNVSFIAGHGGGDYKAMARCMDVINNHQHVFADTAVSRPWQGNIEWMVNQAGSKKIFFGSDMPFYDPSHTFGRIALADISDDDKKSILGLNMLEALDRRKIYI